MRVESNTLQSLRAQPSLRELSPSDEKSLRKSLRKRPSHRMLGKQPSTKSLRNITRNKSLRKVSAADNEQQSLRKQHPRRKSHSPKVEEPITLIIGATGPTGLACLRRFSRHSTKPKLHAFCRDASKLSQHDALKCESVIEGDALKKEDIRLALRKTKANVVLVSIGNGSSPGKTDIRKDSAKALVSVMKEPKFRHVRALVISRVGTRESRDSLGMLGKLKLTSLRHTIKDHKRQEEIFLAGSLRKRVTIVRSTAMKDTEANGQIQEFRSEDRLHKMSISRSDLASWVTNEVCCGFALGGRVANITGAR